MKPIRNFIITPKTQRNQIHMDVFQIHRTYFFLTTSNRFTEIGTVNKFGDKNMITVKTKLQERIAFLGKP